MAGLQHILFVCNLNAIRSPIAEAVVNARFGSKAVAQSCGVWEGGYLDNFMVETLREVGVDHSHHQPRTLDDVSDAAAEQITHIIALSDESATRVEAFAALFPHIAVEQWTLSDPAAEAYSRDARIMAFRSVRDELLQRLRTRFGENP
jgi:protein-tyrosine-phosphatase